MADDLVWVHDYHLIPLASELRAAGITNPIGYFHHIPWPAPEVFGALPGSSELLRVIPDHDLVGVQTERDADNLRRSLVQQLGAVPRRADLLDVGSKRVRIKSAPIGIDVAGFQQAAQRSGSSRLLKQTMTGLGSRKLIIGVDRLDYSKGIPERMEAFERFLVSHPEQRGRVTYLQIAPTSRSEVPEYATLSRAVNETLGRINGSLGEPGWVPIHYVTSTYSRGVLAGLYRLARVGLVTPIRDGMNSCGERIRGRSGPGTSRCSHSVEIRRGCRGTHGCPHRQPERQGRSAEAIEHALHMSREERIARLQASCKSWEFRWLTLAGGSGKDLAAAEGKQGPQQNGTG